MKLCKDCKYFAPKSTHCKRGVPWVMYGTYSCKDFEPKPKMTNFEKLKSMSIDELAIFSCDTYGCPKQTNNDVECSKISCRDCWKRWLEIEVEE